MNAAAAAANGALTPITPDTEAWSPISRYHALNSNDAASLYSPPGSARLPPSIYSAGDLPNRQLSSTPGMNSRRTTQASNGGHPSPPSSVSRSSDGTGLYAASVAGSIDGRPRGPPIQVLEESMAEHYAFLKVYLQPALADEQGSRPTRARDKLLRLSGVQFQELSTDVYDESLRRELDQQKGGPGAPGNETPSFLLPKKEFHPKRNQARQKLSTLPLERFRQLATDVFFELERRFPRFTGADLDRVASPAMSTTSSTRGFRGPPRHASLASNPPNGPPFGPPGGGGPPPPRENSLGRPLPKTFQSNTIVPNKSTMVEDDDSDDDQEDAFGLEGAARRSRRQTDKSLKSLANKNSVVQEKLVSDLQAQVSQLESKVDRLQAELREKDSEVDRLQQEQSRAEQDKEQATDSERELRSSLEQKLEEARTLNDSLRSEIDKIRSDNATRERDLLNDLEEAKQDHQQRQQHHQQEVEELQDQHREQQRHLQQQLQEQQQQQQQQPLRALPARSGTPDDEWKQRYEALERELEEQQQVTEEVRHQASQFLQEMRSLSERSEHAGEREEHLMQQVAQLEADLREWKARYARAKTQLRNNHSSSIAISPHLPDAALYTRDPSFTDSDGLVKDVHVTKFQISIDEFLQTARRPDPKAVLDGMKHVVVCVRQITGDIDSTDSQLASPQTGAGSINGDSLSVVGPDSPRLLSKLRSRVSATANNLITASKNHAAAAGLSPVSLLDAAASHLTTAVVELIRTAKIRPTPATELEEEDYEIVDRPMPLGKAFYSGGHSRSRSRGSVGSERYSGASSPRRLDAPGPGPGVSGHVATGSWASRRSQSINGLGLNGVVASRAPGLAEFKDYLDDQTAKLVHSIQPLVHTLRSAADTPMSPSDESAILTYISDISATVQDSCHKTRDAIDRLGDEALRRHVPPVVQALEDCRAALVDRVGGEAYIDGTAMSADRLREGGREAIPPVAFRIARAMKELVLRVEKIEEGELTVDSPVITEF